MSVLVPSPTRSAKEGKQKDIETVDRLPVDTSLTARCVGNQFFDSEETPTIKWFEAPLDNQYSLK